MRATLAAVLDRLVPADEEGAGALEAGALRYAERALAGALEHLAPAVDAGLTALDAAAQRRAGRAFAALHPAEQDRLLAAMEAGRLNDAPASTFEVLRDLALEGTFGDPRHGGNVGAVGWRLLGFPGARLVVEARDQRLDVAVRAPYTSAADHALFGLGDGGDGPGLR